MTDPQKEAVDLLLPEGYTARVLVVTAEDADGELHALVGHADHISRLTVADDVAIVVAAMHDDLRRTGALS